MKRGLIFLSIFFISLVSAQGLISDILNDIEPSSMLLLTLFIISFILIYLSLSRGIMDKKNASIISVIISLLIIYTINRTAFFQQLVNNFYFDSINFGGTLYSYLFITFIILIIASILSGRSKTKREIDVDWEEFTIGQILSYILVLVGITMLYNNPIIGDITLENLFSLALITIGALVIVLYAPKKK